MFEETRKITLQDKFYLKDVIKSWIFFVTIFQK